MTTKMIEEDEHVHRFEKRYASEFGLYGVCGFGEDGDYGQVDYVLSVRCPCGATPMGLLREMIVTGDFNLEVRS